MKYEMQARHIHAQTNDILAAYEIYEMFIRTYGNKVECVDLIDLRTGEVIESTDMEF